MAPVTDPVLLDNCAISACIKAGGWKALAARYRLETVQEVEREAGTGFHHREILSPRQLRADVRIHPVSDEDRFEALIKYPELAAIDAGERELWVHALSRQGGWVLCGPDIASIHFGVRAGFKDRLISLEKLFDAIGFRPTSKLEPHQTEKWLQATIAPVAQAMAFNRT